MNAVVTPLKIKGLIAPLMRPLPTIFTYARLTVDSKGRSVQVLDDEFTASMTALVEIIEKAGRDAGIPREDWRRVQDQCISLVNTRGEDLAAGLDTLCAELTSLHMSYGRDLQKTYSENSHRYRELYRQVAIPKKLLVCYCEEANNQSDSLERKLTERCYYDYESVGMDWGENQKGSADVVVFAPSQNPIPANLLARAEGYHMPFLILVGFDKKKDMQNMAMLKSAFLYQKADYHVLHSPFNPPRLYSTIDALYLRHLANKVLELPKVAKFAATAGFEAAAERA
jgi:hypothetical protein